MIIDLTHTISPECSVYPGTPAPSFSPASTMARDGYRETMLQMSSHTGTHMDAPRHMLPDGSGLDQLPISQFCGKAMVLDVSGFAPGQSISADFLRAQNGRLRAVDFALFYTGWEKRWDTDAYFEDAFPVPDEAAARYLVSCGLKGVGTDAISVDPIRSTDFPAHKILLSGGLVTVENLCLKKLVGRKNVMFFALPLKFLNADGAPVRAIAEFRDFSEEEGD